MHNPSIPILVVTGASGVGKTSAVAALEARAHPHVTCFYFDDIGVPSPEEMERDFGGGEQWQADATARWMARLAAEGSSSKVNVLDGQTRPSFVRSALSRVSHARSQIVLLDCDSEIRRSRLVSRGHAELATAQMDSWAAYLRGQADALSLPVIDTSRLSVEQVGDALIDVIERLLRNPRAMPSAVETAVDTYIRMWSEPDPAVRGKMLEACFAAEGRMISRNREIHGRVAFAEMMTRFLADPQLLRIRAVSAIDAQGSTFRFRAVVERRDGSILESFDAGQIDADGRISLLLTFGGPLEEAGKT
jgi:broad-specificity NMP kinase